MTFSSRFRLAIPSQGVVSLFLLLLVISIRPLGGLVI
jgi:hypothetical protein